MNWNRLVLRTVSTLILTLALTFLAGHDDKVHAEGALVEALIPYAKQNFTEAFGLLAPLAARGDAVAQLTLGRMYARGEGVPQNSFAAFDWLRAAAEQGEADAQYELAVMCRDGVGAAADGVLALYWFERAADRGAPHAFNAIGELYLDHPDIAQSFDAALEWFTRGAEHDSAEAMYNIAMLYALGRGVALDEIEAFKWFDLAAGFDASHVHENAVRARITLAERLTPLQVWAAKARAEDWKRGCCSSNVTSGLSADGAPPARVE